MKGLLARVIHLVQETTKEAMKAVDQEEFDEAPDVVSRLLVIFNEIPASALAVIKKDIKAEKRVKIPPKIKSAVLKRDNYRCVVCKNADKDSINIHHFIRVADKGQNETQNLVTLCANCHALVHANRIKLKKPRRVPCVD